MKPRHVLSMRLIATLVAMLVVTQSAKPAWNAGNDLTANERPNGPQELINPNATVSEWTYGYRPTVGGTALTLFVGPGQHFNDYLGYPSFDGWVPQGGPSTAQVNPGTSPLVFNLGFGPLVPLQPKEMDVHPGIDGAIGCPLDRPYSSLFTIDAYWNDIDPNGGNGADPGWSPTSYINEKQLPPILLIHGTVDTTVPIAGTDEFVESLKNAGHNDVTYLRVEGANHGVAYEHNLDRTFQAMDEFFDRTLKDRKEAKVSANR